MRRYIKCTYICLHVCTIWQRFMRSYVPGGRNRTCCLSSRCSHPPSSLDCHQVEAYRASKRHKMRVRCKFRPRLGTWHHVISVSQKKLHYFCLLSTKRDTQAHTAKRKYKLNMFLSMILMLLYAHLMCFLTIPVCPGLGRLLRGSSGFYLFRSRECILMLM